MSDVRVEDHGSILVLYPLTAEARDWFTEYLPADRQYWAGGTVVEPRYVDAIVAGLQEAGLVVGQ